jgi:peroxiredoxin
MQTRKIVLVLGIAGLVGCGGASPPPATATAPTEPKIIAVSAEMGTPHPGDPAPDFELPDDKGNKVKLSSMRGSIVMLAFVTSWCPFSKAEQPHLKALADEYAPKGIKFVAVNVNEQEAGYKEYLGRVALPFPVLRDESGDVARSFAPTKALPDFKDRSRVVISSNLVIGADGTIRLFAIADTYSFDAKYVHVRRALDEALAQGGASK